MGAQSSSGHNDTRNQGEGNKAADQRYREKTREFVESGKVEPAAEKASNMSPKEKKESRRAEEIGKSKARK